MSPRRIDRPGIVSTVRSAGSLGPRITSLPLTSAGSQSMDHMSRGYISIISKDKPACFSSGFMTSCFRNFDIHPLQDIWLGELVSLSLNLLDTYTAIIDDAFKNASLNLRQNKAADILSEVHKHLSRKEFKELESYIFEKLE